MYPEPDHTQKRTSDAAVIDMQEARNCPYQRTSADLVTPAEGKLPDLSFKPITRGTRHSASQTAIRHQCIEAVLRQGRAESLLSVSPSAGIDVTQVWRPKA